MLKLLTITSLLSTSILANSDIENKLIDFEQKRVGAILKRQNIDLDSVNIVLKKDLQYNNWYGYAFDLKFNVKGKEINQKDFLFSDGELIAPELINTNTKSSYKDIMYPTLTSDYYSKEHLIAGNENAPHKLVIFSDPLCPICVDEIPFVMKKVMENPENIALYYFHMPLEMHPTAKVLAKASMIAKEQGIKDIDYKLYTANSKYFYGDEKDMEYEPYEERDPFKALNYFNKTFNTNITMDMINSSKYEDKLKYDLKMADEAFVNGTPTIFFDGNIDKSRTKYEKFLK